MSDDGRVNRARALWDVREVLIEEARQLRADARMLDEEAARIDSLAAAVQDGRPLSEVVGGGAAA